jgi:DNA-binding winged helix-turn-helix (wHTH) protein
VRVKIQEQPFRVLILLAEASGEIVTRETLRQELWPAGTFVDFDGSLNVIMKKLRAVLGDDPDNPRFIETVPRHGYRFIAPVSRTEIPAPGGKTPPPFLSAVRERRKEPAGASALESTPAPAAVRAGGSAKFIYASAALILLAGLCGLDIAGTPGRTCGKGSRQHGASRAIPHSQIRGGARISQRIRQTGRCMAIYGTFGDAEHGIGGRRKTAPGFGRRRCELTNRPHPGRKPTR